MENIKDADILLIPVGGFYTIDAKTAVKIADIIKPEILIPMHFNDPKLNQEAFGKLLGVDESLSLERKTWRLFQNWIFRLRNYQREKWCY